MACHAKKWGLQIHTTQQQTGARTQGSPDSKKTHHGSAQKTPIQVQAPALDQCFGLSSAKLASTFSAVAGAASLTD
jgi:hypothetical protein